MLKEDIEHLKYCNYLKCRYCYNIKNNIMVVTLIGSVSQKDKFDYYNELLTKNGYAVFSCGCWMPELHDKDENKDYLKGILQAIHRKKIECSDIVAYILKEDGSLGNHSMDEYNYGVKTRKIVVNVKDFVIMVNSDKK